MSTDDAGRVTCPATEGADVRLLERIGPIEWDNVLLYGEYVIDRGRMRVA